MIEAAAARLVASTGPAAGDQRFAGYLRIVGRGASLGRQLDTAEAEAAFGMILDGQVAPVQLGAFLLVLRYRTEAPSELAGMIQAARRRFAWQPPQGADLDWPSYADRHKQLPYFLLAAKLLAGTGTRILMHGIAGEGAATTRAGLAALHLPVCHSQTAAKRALAQRNVAYLPLEAFCPPLADLFALRPLLGLRTPVNSAARALNPGQADAQLQGVFHPTYLPLQQATAQLLQQPRALIFKGGGGEAQRNPDKPCRAIRVQAGTAAEEVWPSLQAKGEAPYPWRQEPLEVARLAAIWLGDEAPAAPLAAVLGTAAMALRLRDPALDPAAAMALARQHWDARDRRL